MAILEPACNEGDEAGQGPLKRPTILPVHVMILFTVPMAATFLQLHKPKWGSSGEMETVWAPILQN
jgi:sorbitol-specific phosphotransferase system component IIC